MIGWYFRQLIHISCWRLIAPAAMLIFQLFISHARWFTYWLYWLYNMLSYFRHTYIHMLRFSHISLLATDVIIISHYVYFINIFLPFSSALNTIRHWPLPLIHNTPFRFFFACHTYWFHSSYYAIMHYADCWFLFISSRYAISFISFSSMPATWPLRLHILHCHYSFVDISITMYSDYYYYWLF